MVHKMAIRGGGERHPFIHPIHIVEWDCYSLYTGLAGKNLRDLFPRVRGKKVGKKGVITQFFPRFFPSMGEKPISTDLFTQPK